MADSIDIPECTQKKSAEDERLIPALIDFFSSMKVAIGLLLILAVVSGIGTVVEQNTLPREFQTSRTWLDTLGLTNLYSSAWYKVLLSLVGINLMVCSLKRFGLTWRRAYKPKISTDVNTIQRMQRSETLQSGLGLEATLENVKASLSKRGYRVQDERDESDTSLLAVKGSSSLWGPYLTHVSLLVIFLGAIIGYRFGFEGYTTIAKGESTTIYYPRGSQHPKELGFRVGMTKFRIDVDEGRNPTTYRSNLQVFEGDEMVAEKFINVNHPLTYRGVSFFQSDYGIAGAMIEITSPDGESAEVPVDITTYSVRGGKLYEPDSEFRQVEIGGETLTLFIHRVEPDYCDIYSDGMTFMPLNPALQVMINDRFPEYRGLDAWTSLGWITQDQPAEYKGYTIALADVIDYTGLSVHKNPGIPIIFGGFGLMMLGIWLAFYVVRRTIRVRITRSEEGVMVYAGSSSRAETSSFDKDFQQLASAVAGKSGI